MPEKLRETRRNPRNRLIEGIGWPGGCSSRAMSFAALVDRVRVDFVEMPETGVDAARRRCDSGRWGWMIAASSSMHWSMRAFWHGRRSGRSSGRGRDPLGGGSDIADSEHFCLVTKRSRQICLEQVTRGVAARIIPEARAPSQPARSEPPVGSLFSTVRPRRGVRRDVRHRPAGTAALPSR